MKFNQQASKKSIIIMAVVTFTSIVSGYVILFPPLPSELFNDDNSTIVIIPILTANAYEDHGFYDYYRDDCDEECLKIDLINPPLKFSSSKRTVEILQSLHYNTITDLELATDPSIISKYEKVILLHSEYVTREMFDAITSHPKVIYMFPNALYGEVTVSNNIMTLIKGHGYPTRMGWHNDSVVNPFNWKFENTHPEEYDDKCNDWKFREVDNGYQLNCYPDMVIKKKYEILKALKDL